MAIGDISEGTQFGRYRPVQSDFCTWAAVGIEYEHYEVHAGSMFSAYVIDSDFDAQDTINIAFRTPDTTARFHLTIDASATTFSQLDLLEAATVSAGATFTPRNRRRDVTTISAAVDPVDGITSNRVRTNVTVNAAGNTLESEMVGAGRSQGGSIGKTRGTSEWVLLSNTVYVVRLTGNGVGSANQIATIILTWYEHADKN